MGPPGWIDRLAARADPRGVRLWGPGFLRSLVREPPDPAEPVHVYVCVADHFEPRWHRPSLDVERRRVATWVERYPLLAKRHRDTSGRAPVRTFFFPVEEYRTEHLDGLASLVRDGYADVEVHLHHDDDTAENLRRTLTDFARTLHDGHGLLRRDPDTGAVRYAFIHGNWALDNSHPEGRFCGVDNELRVLVETGCYVDMTLPSVPSPTQSRMVNTIFYARGRDGQGRGHDTGEPVRVGGSERPGDLMLIPGPLGIHWNSRRFRLVPRIEAAMLEPGNPVPARERIAAWVRHAPTVLGAPNHRFVKLHAHGANGDAPEYFLAPGGPFDTLLGALEAELAHGGRTVLHYVTAREMYDTVRRLEAGGSTAART